MCANLNSTSGFSLARGNILPTFRLRERCGNSLDPLMQNTKTLAAVNEVSASAA